MTRIVFKIGTSSLTNADGSLAPEKIVTITKQIAQLHQAGYQLVIVSSGSIAAGFQQLGYRKRPKQIADKQACAAVGQGLLMEHYTENLLRYDITSAQILLTQDDFVDSRRYQNAFQALSVLLKRGAIPIINENDTVAIEELKVGDNDSLSAQVAAMVQADLLVLMTDVDGLYTANPHADPSAQHLAHIDELTPDIIQMAGGSSTSNGTGGMLTKLKAAAIATTAGVPVFICDSRQPNAFIQAVSQTNRGTYFSIADKTLRNRQQWLVYYAKAKGAIYVDAGASKALLNQGKSLLLSGITNLEGNFQARDVVAVYDQTTQALIGKGKVKLSHYVLAELIDQKQKHITVIHRDDWSASSDLLNHLLNL